jgi:polysaccharide biosynthesis/export protein
MGRMHWLASGRLSLRMLYPPVLILLSLLVAAAGFAQTAENRPADKKADSPAAAPSAQAPTGFPTDPAAPSGEGFPSLITMPDLSEMKGGDVDAGNQTQAQPNPPAEPGQQNLPDYHIGAGDVLKVSVWKEPEVSVDGVAVRSDGKISLPLIKEVVALGLAPTELESILTREFSHYINNPAVTVIVKEINSQKVYLVGGVVRPGSLPLRTPMTVLQVLAEAGGLTDYAKRKKIYILRKQGGQESRLQFNYEAVLKGESPEQNVPVRAGDTIVVPE